MPNNDSKGNPLRARPPAYLKLLVDQDMPSSDPGDTSFSSSQGLYQSTSRIYSWNFLEGHGKLDSSVECVWIYNGVDISCDLMDFRSRVIQENGGLNYPHRKL